MGFVGPDGAGKSTALRAIWQLTALNAGEVRWNGHTDGFAMCQRIGYMPEERGLYPPMWVADQITVAGHGDLPPLHSGYRAAGQGSSAAR